MSEDRKKREQASERLVEAIDELAAIDEAAAYEVVDALRARVTARKKKSGRLIKTG